ncbi:hypothetical protein GR238_36475 [Rhizobium leguminosarum]|uniref:hypothetical protein n=1 Tax=Rhizobium ruizarguesonis TaxID=2081791 RepID=UPI0013B71368|nr:hypothetical protein [Rhizobium ruizarguesonis]NEJ10823.1 hypothetical protein [Rhizobium ruizarguesonis]
MSDIAQIAQRLIKWDTDFPVNCWNGYAGLKELDRIIADAKVALTKAGLPFVDDLCDAPPPVPLTEAQQQAQAALDKVMNCRFSNFDAGAVIHWVERGMYQVKVNAPTQPAPAAHVAGSKAEAFDRIVAARKKHVDAVAAYNVRRELADAERMRGSWAIKLDAEYHAMSDAQSEFHRTVQDACDAALAAALTEGAA